MSEASTSVSVGGRGVGFLGLLTLIFITLKLTGVISWSWWWVLAPLWLGAVLSIAVCLFLLAVAFIVFAIREAIKK